jgi:hypothetical protein
MNIQRGDSTKTYLWCDRCRRSFRHEESPDGACPVCGALMQPTGKMSAILRGLMANELAGSPIVTKHRQIVRLIWTRNGQGEEYYRLLQPQMPYNRFESRVTELICRGAEEGWLTIVIPASPSADERLYRIEFHDEDRFLAELDAIAASPARR